MIFEQFIEELKKRIRLDEVALVFDLLLEHLLPSSDKADQRDLLYARYSDLGNQKIDGTLTFEEEELRQNRLRKAILSLINSLTTNDVLSDIAKLEFETLKNELKIHVREMGTILNEIKDDIYKFADKIDAVYKVLDDYAEGVTVLTNFETEEQLATVGFEKIKVTMDIVLREADFGIDRKLAMFRKLSTIIDKMILSIEESTEDINESILLEGNVRYTKELAERFRKYLVKEMEQNQLDELQEGILEYFKDVEDAISGNEELEELNLMIETMANDVNVLVEKISLSNEKMKRLEVKTLDQALSMELTLKMKR